MADSEQTKERTGTKDDIGFPNGITEEMKELWREKMGPVDGIYLPAERPGAPKWDVKVEQIRNLKLRDDDVFLLTYPKSGTHWLWEVMSMVVRGTAELDPVPKVQYMLEFVDSGVLNESPSPRIFNTHCPLSMLPLPEIIARRSKIVHVYRNPKSTCVSMFFMAKSIPFTTPVPTGSFQDFFNYYFFSNYVIYGDCFTYLRKMSEFQQQNPQVPCLNISYEDAKKEPVKCVRQIADFMKKDLSDELCAQIAEACSFDNMKKANAEGVKRMPQLRERELTLEEQEKMKHHPRPVVYRKGEIGDWKNHFTVAMNEAVDKLIAKEMEGLPFTLTFE